MEKTILAICYDFDKTLSPNDMQAQGYIQAVCDGYFSHFEKSQMKWLIYKMALDSIIECYIELLGPALGQTRPKPNKGLRNGGRTRSIPSLPYNL